MYCVASALWGVLDGSGEAIRSVGVHIVIKALWSWFWGPTARFGWGAIFVAGGVAGVIFWGGFNTFMEYTNTLDFCISCHEMEENVYREYEGTVHYTNASGVRAVCSDCHVPKPWTAKLVRKIKASREVYHKILGTIDTPEKFDEKRLQLATNVWNEMKGNNSRECRNCHDFEAMDLTKQERRARKKHPKAMKKGQTCIDCHKGIAHELPAGMEDE